MSSPGSKGNPFVIRHFDAKREWHTDHATGERKTVAVLALKVEETHAPDRPFPLGAHLHFWFDRTHALQLAGALMDAADPPP